MAQQSKAHENPVKAPLASHQTSPSTSTAAPTTTDDTSDIGNKIATVAVVGLGAALIEAELIPGILIGAAAMLMPSVFPRFGKALRPLVKQTVRAGYAIAGRAREGVAELNEQVQDIVAEVKSETNQAANTSAGHNEAAPATAPQPA